MMGTSLPRRRGVRGRGAQFLFVAKAQGLPSRAWPLIGVMYTWLKTGRPRGGWGDDGHIANSIRASRQSAVFQTFVQNLDATNM